MGKILKRLSIVLIVVIAIGAIVWGVVYINNINKNNVITVSTGDTIIPYASSTLKEDNKDNNELFVELIDIPSNLPYFGLGSEISIAFAGEMPSSIEMYDIALNAEGRSKYSVEPNPVDFKSTGNTVKFSIPFNPAANLSSDIKDYDKGASIRGFKLICSFGNTKSEYAFVLRTDASKNNS